MALWIVNLFLIVSFAIISVDSTAPVPTDTQISLSAKEPRDDLYRLQQKITVSSYSITITVPVGFENNNLNFDGEVTIIFISQDAVNKFYLNSVDLQITGNPSLKKEGPDQPELIKDKADRDPKYEIIGYELTENFVPAEKYVYTAKYKGKFQTELLGFYKTKYKNAEGNDEYILSTQFQPTNARRIMPCLDEPEYKSIFDMTIKFPKGYKALFNTQGIPAADEGDYHITRFLPTPSMSTYLLAIMVTKFHWLETVTNQITHRVWSQPNYGIDSSVYALKNSYKTIEAMKAFTGKDYKDVGINKIDHIGLPDFQAGAMENWGLITYRDSLLLYNYEESPTSFHRHICTIVSHELAHFWFGNLKTTKWWDTIWLNEGFATYFEYMASAKVEPEWELDYQFVIDKHFAVMNPDSTSGSKPLNQDVDSPAAIMGKFDVLTYSKGGSIIRMMRLWTDEAGFNTHLAKYFNNQENSVVPNNLWAAMEGIVENAPATITNIMNSYVEKPGLPLLIVEQNGKVISITQKRFLFTKPEQDDTTKYYVPITYTGEGNSEISFENTKPKCWLVADTETPCTFTLKDENDLFFINLQASAYARVKYQEKHWLRIRTALNEGEFKKIHVLNRVQLIEDAFALARGGQMNYDLTLNIVSYLENEDSYYPWYSGFKGFEFLLRRFNSESNEAKQLKKMILDLMTTVYTKPNPEEKPHITALKNSLLKTWRCNLGDNDCINDMVALFDNIKTKKRIHPNLRSIVYCTALRESDTRENWDLLFARYKETNVPTEAMLILPTLGCTKIKEVLREYLDTALDLTSDVIRTQDRSRIFSFVLDGNPENVATTSEYFKDKYDLIQTVYPDVAERASLAGAIIGKLTTDNEINQFRELVTAINDAALTPLVQKELEAAAKNVEWANKNKDVITTYAEKFLKRKQKEEEKPKPPNDDGGAGSIFGSFLLIICSAFFLLLKSQWL